MSAAAAIAAASAARAPCLVETAFLNLPGLARDTKLITIGSEHYPNDGDRLLAFERWTDSHRALHVVDIGFERRRLLHAEHCEPLAESSG